MTGGEVHFLPSKMRMHKTKMRMHAQPNNRTLG